MLHLFEANDLQLLANEIAQRLITEEIEPDPFLQQWIVVQNKETQSWLQAQISQINGISANLKFVLPSELAWHIIRLYKPTLSVELPTDRVAIQARTIDLLNSNKSELKKLGLLVPEDPLNVVTLSESISDVFDLYQVFRPDMLMNWSNEHKGLKKVEAWQAFIWQNLMKDISKDYPELPYRFTLNEQIIEFVQFNSEVLPRNIFIFGLSHWSKTFFDFVNNISKQVDIHWYDQKITFEGLGESKFRDWAKPKLDVQNLFLSQGIQSYFNNKTQPSTEILPDNKKIHSCHNVEREVQVLKNELLLFLDKNKQFTIEDALILVPDFELYAPIIENEFSSQGYFPSIPVFISEQHSDSTNELLLQLLRFYQDGEKITDFLELLNQSAIKKAFALTDSEIGFYEKAFAEMNIHFGLSKGDTGFSIEKGVDQLLLSYSMLMGNYNIYHGYVLLDLRSNIDTKFYIAKLARIHRSLISLKAELIEEHTLLYWLQSIHMFLRSFLSDQASVFQSIEKLLKQIQFSHPEVKIPFDAFHQWLSNQIIDQSASSTRMGTGVTISSYIPYRNIPFKFVAILGLNEGVFPRNIYRPEFDLIHNDPLPGDRITKNDDALLFLERIYATENHLHLSYIGEGEQGDMPSSLIQELLDFQSDIPIIRHKLHSFSVESTKNVPSYSTLETEIATLLHSKHEEGTSRFFGIIDLEANKEINLNDFLQFFSHPSKHLLVTILGLKNTFEAIQPTNREAFILAGLDKYKLKKELVEFYQHSNNFETFQSYGLAKGVIPRGITGLAQLKEENTFVQLIQNHVQQYLGMEESTFDLKTEYSEVTMLGSISNIYGHERVLWKISEVKPKDVIQLWVNHLFLILESESFKRSIIIGLNDKKEVIRYEFNKIDDPSIELKTYLDIFITKQPSKYNWSCIPALAKNFIRFKDAPEKQATELLKSWYSDKYSFKEDSDYFNKTLWSDELPWENDLFGILAEKIWAPLIEHLEVSKL